MELGILCMHVTLIVYCVISSLRVIIFVECGILC